MKPTIPVAVAALVLLAGGVQLIQAGPGMAAPAPGLPAAVARVASQAPKAPARLHREGRWLVDPQGRVVIVHGLNLVYKRAPYAPPDTAAGFTAKDARFLKHFGFNGVRLGVLWAGATPTRAGVADPAYFARIDRVTRLLAARQIWMLFDAHQDEWSQTYGGEGAPTWADRRPAPYAALPPLTAPFPTGYWMPELSTVFDNFWADKGHLLDGFAQFWKVVAEHYRNQPYSMGYDLFNEPWAGTEWLSCLTAGCKSSYAKELQPAMTKVLRAVRTVDRRNVVWFEPQQFFAGQKVGSYYTPVAGEKNLGLSWHNYCPAVFLESTGLPLMDVKSCVAYTANRESVALDQADRMHAAALMTEWGATDNLTAIGIDAAGADTADMGWTYWAYKHWNDPTTADASQGLFADDADLSTVKPGKLRLLVRTYPQATAGTPGPISFEPTSGAFHYTYRPNPSVHAPTRIFVSPLAYPRGWKVSLSHARVVKRNAHHVWVRAAGETTVTVRISRR